MTIQIKQVSKRFGEIQALDQIDLEFGDNKIYGLLGNNGAGKTTLLNILTGRYLEDSGSITIDGIPHHNSAALAKLYMMSEKNLFPDEMKVKDALKWTARFHPNFDHEFAQQLIHEFKLPLKQKIQKLSTGYSSIFKMVLALSVNTEYVLLDEPVLGLDAQHRDMFYRFLMEAYANHPRTIILSTHLIAEAANMIEHTVIISKGRILADQPVEELLSQGYTISGPAAAIDDYLRDKEVLSLRQLGGIKTACVHGVPQNPGPSLEVARLELQDYFVSLMNESEVQANA